MSNSKSVTLSHTEENYLKAIYHLSEHGTKEVNTNAVSEVLQTRPASVSDMLRKLSAKKMINYIKYQGVTVTENGKKEALQVIRKHRLWEVFLVEKLKFNWDEVHEIAEQLEHIQSKLLIKRLDEFLGFPSYDPHGDPIPNEAGEFTPKPRITLSEAEVDSPNVVVGLKETSSPFLQFLDKTGIYIGAKIKILERIAFDQSLEITIDENKTLNVSSEVAKNIYVTD
ncbi:metal-dependent transcriptional regulator [Cytophagaceae bacterium ABcell3]|nr:metal-dependent transcriptional regulator [Cytophagaceae bacterium ABcell3]